LNNYNNNKEFVQWVEVNRIFGAQRFLVYNFTGGSALLPYLDYYANQKLMNVYSWQMGPFQHQIPHIAAQCVLINDCVYRSMYKTKYLLLHDIDEVMVPQRADNWMQAIEALTQCKNNAVLMVRNVFFPKNYKQSTAPGHSQYLDLIHRISFNHSCRYRSKLIVQPDKVIHAGTHFVIKTISPNVTACCMSAEDIQMQHYRYVSGSMLVEMRIKEQLAPSPENVLPHTRMRHFERALISAINSTRKGLAS
jgi:hypothetical protein